MASDALAGLVRILADLGHDLATTLGDPGGRESLMARAGLPAPAGAPPSGQAAAGSLDALRDRAAASQHGGSAGGDPGGGDTLLLLKDLSDSMVTLVSLVQQAAATDDVDDAWNLLATFLDVIALDRLRSRNPQWLALLQAAHLVSNDRLLIADLIRSGDQWGSFLLGHPQNDDAKADNWSLLLGAVMAVVGAVVPPEDDTGKRWRTDMLFGWDPQPSDDRPHITRVLQRMATIRFTHRGGDGVEEHAGLSIVVVPPADGGWGMFVALDVGAGLTFPVRSHLELVMRADVPTAVEAFIGDPPFALANGAGTNVVVQLRRKRETADHWVIGSDVGLHLEIGTFLVGVEIGDPTRFRLSVGDGALVLPKASLGFLGFLLPSGGAKFGFDVDLMVDTKGRLTFAGGAGLSVTVPVNTTIAVLSVRNVTLALALEAGGDGGAGASLATTVAFGLDFGPSFKVAVDGIGAKLRWTLPSSPSPVGVGTPVEHGNLGPAGDLGIDFVPPRGIGIVLDVGPVKGGGFLFFDPAHRTYGGVLEAALALCGKGLQIKAAGLLRETDDGWSFVLIVSAQFEPGIEIFLGLTLNGVGGMVGINVAVDVDRLRAGLHDGAVGRLLFPDDPVANAPAIIATMAAVFPPRQGGWVAGPMLQLGWGRPTSFVTLSVAVVLAFPSPALLAILGRLRVAVPHPDLALIDIKADFLGVLSFEEPSVSFDAALVDSRLTAFSLTGELALRVSAEGFMLSVGGFHPRFTPPANVPALRRVAIDISANPFTKIRAEAYLAVTSNTFQVGLHASLDIEAGDVVSIHGWLDFDALVQWEPHFRFSIHMSIGLELRVGGESMAGVSVDLLLEGPGPWHAKGQASLHLLFFTIHAGFEVTWGEVEATPAPPEIDAARRVADALSTPGAWTAVAPSGDAVVTLRAVQRDEIGVHPYGQLTARQQAVPLGIPVSRIGRSHVVGGSATVTVAPVAGAPASAPTSGLFAAAQFQELTDDQRLSRPSFESFQDGVTFGAAGTVVGIEQLTTASYETVFIPDARRRRDRFDLRLLTHALEVGAVTRAGLHHALLNDGPTQPVRVKEEAFRVVAADTLAGVAGGADTFSSASAAFVAAGEAVQRVLVVGAHEAAG